MLSKLFNVERDVVRQVAPNSQRYHEMIAKNNDKLSRLRPYKKRLIRAKRELKRKERLQRVIAERKYDFPNQVLE